MNRKILTLSLVTATALTLISAKTFAAEKLKFGTAVREYPGFYLSMMAAQEKGLWEENGLEVEWVPFGNPVAEMQAVAAGVLSIGMVGSSVLLQTAARGLPVVMVSHQYERPDFILWVRTDSPHKEPKDLKGTKIGISSLGAQSHTYGRVITKAAGVEKDVIFVGTGTVPASIAALRAGQVDAVVYTLFQLITLQLAGQVRPLALVSDYVPKEWVEQGVFAHKELIRTKPEVVRRAIKAVLKANQFVLETPTWAVEKMKANSGYPEEAARIAHGRLALSKTGRISAKGMENVRNFYIEFGLVPKEKAPPVDELYTPKLLE